MKNLLILETINLVMSYQTYRVKCKIHSHCDLTNLKRYILQCIADVRIDVLYDIPCRSDNTTKTDSKCCVSIWGFSHPITLDRSSLYTWKCYWNNLLCLYFLKSRIGKQKYCVLTDQTTFVRLWYIRKSSPRPTYRQYTIVSRWSWWYRIMEKPRSEGTAEHRLVPTLHQE